MLGCFLGTKATWLDLGKDHFCLEILALPQTWLEMFQHHLKNVHLLSHKHGWYQVFTLANVEKQTWTVSNCLAWQPFFLLSSSWYESQVMFLQCSCYLTGKYKCENLGVLTLWGGSPCRPAMSQISHWRGLKPVWRSWKRVCTRGRERSLSCWRQRGALSPRSLSLPAVCCCPPSYTRCCSTVKLSVLCITLFKYGMLCFADDRKYSFFFSTSHCFYW